MSGKHLFSEPPPYTIGSFYSNEQSTVEHVISHHFHRCYLEAHKLIKSKGTRKVEQAYHFWKCANAVCQKLSKLVHARWNYNLPNLARFSETQGTDVINCAMQNHF